MSEAEQSQQNQWSYRQYLELCLNSYESIKWSWIIRMMSHSWSNLNHMLQHISLSHVNRDNGIATSINLDFNKIIWQNKIVKPEIFLKKELNIYAWEHERAAPQRHSDKESIIKYMTSFQWKILFNLIMPLVKTSGNFHSSITFPFIYCERREDDIFK